MTISKYKFLSKQLKGNYKYLFTAVIFILIGSFFSFLGPKLIGVAVDSIIGTAPFDLPVFVTEYINSLGGREYFLRNIWIVILVFVGIKITEAVCEFLRLYASNHLGENLGYNMRQTLFERLQSATFAYHKSIYTGDIIQRCSTDIDTVRMFVLEMTDIIRVVSKIAIAYWFMAGISVPLALVSFTTVPLVSAFSIFFGGKIRQRFLAADEAEGELQSRVQENLSAPRVVRAFGKQKQERDLFEAGNNLFSDMWLKMGDVMAWFWAIGDLLPVLQVILVLSSGTYFAVQGLITPGQIISFMVYNNMLAWPIRSLGRIIGNMAKATVALGRITEVYNADQEDYESGSKFDIKGDIEFKNVSFSFGRQKIFENLSFTVPAGQTVAILGASGSGKSTILALLARFYDVDSGEITIDGVNVKDINLHTLRQNVGIVMQEPFLFGKTIKENISITDSHPDMDRIVRSTEIAQVHRSITNFEKGYDTIVGEKGVTLSGGQKQRVAIARTLYSGARILCFDDSLSAVDSLTDANIRKELHKRVEGITTIIISQRVNTLMEADKILVLDRGTIVQQGTHAQLADQPGIYREIVKIQSDIIEQTRQEAKG
ncbi:MAG: ABC transporter ATP-binding protein [Oscillospiraceae bacterium]|nr:ABC transporter ATP-binding protein [Oscillospiraceae bacterium]